jgi:hypothetical protein
MKALLLCQRVPAGVHCWRFQLLLLLLLLPALLSCVLRHCPRNG